MLQLSLDLYYTEDEIYELSYTKEPRNPKIQVSLVLFRVIGVTLVLTFAREEAHACNSLWV